MTNKSFTPYEFKLNEAGDVTIAFSQFDVLDSDGDVTRAGSMPVGKSVPMSAYGHTSWDGALPVGKGVISERAGFGIFDGRFFMDTDQGRNTYNTVKAMADLQEHSYGYKVLDGSPITFEGTRAREIRKLDVYEVSPVLVGAGVGTATLAIKSGRPGPDAPYAEHLSWYVDGLPDLLDRVKDRSAFRAKEGRVLSAANMAALTELVDALEGHKSALSDLIAAATPKDAAQMTAIEAARIENLLAMARANGVPV